MKRLPNGYYEWSKEDDQYLMDNYLEMPIKTMARKWGFCENVVRRRMKKLGLSVPPELAEKRRKESVFKKGHVPFNKGMRMEEFMSPEAIEKSRATRYKKGHLPHNHMPGVGHITVRKDSNGNRYKHIKLEEGKWEMLHVHLWKKENGPIPKGMIIAFKDGDQMNCVLDNLEEITLAENLKRNRKGYLELPEELRTSKRLINKIQKKITNERKRNTGA